MICVPNLFRYLNGTHIDSFFQDGSLRLSSFAAFHSHADEQRLDPNEGYAAFIHRTPQRGGQTLLAKAQFGANAYVLSTAMRYSRTLQEAFECDSYFEITNSSEFGAAIAKQIPGCVGYFEGACIYKRRKVVSRDLGYLDLSKYVHLDDPNTPKKVKLDAINELILPQFGHLPAFLKDDSFSHQCEYRFVWTVDAPVEPFLALRVPSAVQYCMRSHEDSEYWW